MRTTILLSAFLFMLSQTITAQGGFGFFDLSYSSVAEDFIDNSSEAFINPDLQLNESGIGLGGSGVFVFRNFAIGGGGGTVIMPKSNKGDVNFTVGHGYGIFGYNFSQREDMLIIPSLRIGAFGNTMIFQSTEADPYQFGDVIFPEGEIELRSGGFSIGAEVNIIKTFDLIPGVAVAISGFYNAPLTALDWTYNNVEVTGFENGSYSHAGITIKFGGGGGNFVY